MQDLASQQGSSQQLVAGGSQQQLAATGTDGPAAWMASPSLPATVDESAAPLPHPASSYAPHSVAQEPANVQAAPMPPQQHRYRIKWDNIIIVLLALGALLVSAWWLSDAPAADEPAAAETQAVADDAPAEPANAADMEAAKATVAEARTLMDAGDFDGARALIESLDVEVNMDSGASDLLDELDLRERRYNELATQAQRLADEDRPADALRSLRELAGIAPLTDELTALKVDLTKDLAIARKRDLISQLLADGKGEDALAQALAAQRAYGDEFDDLVAEARAVANGEQAAASAAAAPISGGGGAPLPMGGSSADVGAGSSGAGSGGAAKPVTGTSKPPASGSSGTPNGEPGPGAVGGATAGTNDPAPAPPGEEGGMGDAAPPQAVADGPPNLAGGLPVQP